MMSKLLIATILVVLCSIRVDAKIRLKRPCTKANLTYVDRCARDGFFLLNSDFTGHQGNSATEYCDQVTASIKCIENFNTKCLDDRFTVQTAQMGVKGIKNHQKTICPKVDKNGRVGPAPSGQAEFLRKTAWFDKTASDKLSGCVQGSVKNMNFIANQVPSKDQIPQACCNYILTRECLNQRIDKLTTEENKKYLENMADDALHSMINSLCSKYDNMNKCKNNAQMKVAMKRMSPAFKNKQAASLDDFQSILIPFLEVLTD